MYNYELIRELDVTYRWDGGFPIYPWEGFDLVCIADPSGDHPGPDVPAPFWPMLVRDGPDQGLEEYEHRLTETEAVLKRITSENDIVAHFRKVMLDRRRVQQLSSYIRQLRGEPNSIPMEAGLEYHEWVQGLRRGGWVRHRASKDDTERTLCAFERHQKNER